MTSRELKFALKVEALLNTVDDPEYRQLLVEVLMVLSLVVTDDPAQPLGHTIVVDHILQDANHLFVEDQVSVFVCLPVCVDHTGNFYILYGDLLEPLLHS